MPPAHDNCSTCHSRLPADSAELDESFQQCPHFSGYNEITAIREDLDEIKEAVKAISELAKVYSDAKGFIAILQALGAVAKWTVATVAAVAALWLAFKHGITGE